MTAELPKVIWTRPDGYLRAVLRVDKNAASIAIERKALNAMCEPTWVDPGYGVGSLAIEIIADLSGVKWRE